MHFDELSARVFTEPRDVRAEEHGGQIAAELLHQRHVRLTEDDPLIGVFERPDILCFAECSVRLSDPCRRLRRGWKRESVRRRAATTERSLRKSLCQLG